MRTVRFEIPTDTSQFTPLQLQPRFILWLGMTGWARWMKQYVVPFPDMIKTYETGVVVLSVHLEYLEPFHFLDADSIEVEVSWRARLGGVLMESRYDGFAAGKKFATATSVVRPVRLKGLDALAATPSRLSRSLLQYFEPDEVDRTAPERRLPALLECVERGELTAEGHQPLVLHRHHCEVADQWSYIEVASHVGGARESLALARAGDVPALRGALSRPLRSFDMELAHPMYVFDEATITSRAYTRGDELAFVHRIAGAQEHAIVVEQFQTPTEAG